MLGVEIEIEASEMILPTLYYLTPNSNDGQTFSPNDKWVILDHVASFLKAASPEEVLTKLPDAVQRDLTAEQFLKHAVPLNVDAPDISPSGKVFLLRYDDSLRELFNVEVTNVSILD